MFTTNRPTPSRSHLPANLHEIPFYFKAGVFGLLVFGLANGYLRWMNIPGELNKSLADTAIFLMASSMLLTSLCYFWPAVNRLHSYRKYLGLVGFAFAVAHLVLSWDAFLALLKITTWQQGKMWPAFMGAVAIGIFAMMALVSNSVSTRLLGVKRWRYVLRTGYVAVLLVLAHVILLKSARWVTWYQGGMKTGPSLSLMVSIYAVIVVVMRILLWWSLKRRNSR